ncbi:hypothetical protein C823_004270 [Eubacterium plexicaudatum ASF492]|uniref:ATP-grasp domain-containing protein n=1 Tax=Eubacterium plexicaudatum ASF492 TaxID=1235802 RepID=N2ABN9_9FIRM|nr:hypothetical protein C823_004270 [Eubacterium plexicaudatum ASF492]
MKEKKAAAFPQGRILYTEGDSSLNPHYIELYRNACKKYGLRLQFGTYDPNLPATEGLSACRMEDGSQECVPQFVINRTRNERLAECLEQAGICVFNSSFVTKIGNDKAEAYRYMQQRNIPIMPTVYGTRQPPQWYPAVVKSCDGHGGTEVYFVQNKEEWQRWKEQSRQETKRYVIQKAASDFGMDVRVYVVGNKIKAAVLRRSRTDFRSNYCLGGHVRMYRLSAVERELAERVIDGLSIGMAGIDFIFHQGQMVFNELEDVAGARGLYTLTDYDIVDDYVKYITEQMTDIMKKS